MRSPVRSPVRPLLRRHVLVCSALGSRRLRGTPRFRRPPVVAADGSRPGRGCSKLREQARSGGPPTEQLGPGSGGSASRKPCGGAAHRALPAALPPAGHRPGAAPPQGFRDCSVSRSFEHPRPGRVPSAATTGGRRNLGVPRSLRAEERRRLPGHRPRRERPVPCLQAQYRQNPSTHRGPRSRTRSRRASWAACAHPSCMMATGLRSSGRSTSRSSRGSGPPRLRLRPRRGAVPRHPPEARTSK